MITQIKNAFKNLLGWKTNKKLILFSVDDYGNVRLDSKEAREQLDTAGLKNSSRFDAYDTLETREDLQLLYATLSSIKDKNNKSAVFTPYALSCNIAFEKMAANNFSEYAYELLPETYKKLTTQQADAYSGAWELWQQGIATGLMAPQFHGREHLNLKVFHQKLKNKDADILAALKNNSYTSINTKGYNIKSYTAAFAFQDVEDLKTYPEIIKSGLDAFEKVYGYRATVFTPPAQQFHPSLEHVLWENGIQAIDKPFTAMQHLGNSKYKRQWNTTGIKKNNKITLVRNVVFEPTDNRNIDWVDFTMQQIAAAFRWNKPANISSHRVNFCGHIDSKNRETGLAALKSLLQQIVKRWPDVEFISAAELVEIIRESKN
ncbi:MAG: hypothetical protein IPN31_05810 [Bacteroidetes bacterium]|nr:hypothetical protein [Bacteroidota bacterium]